MRKQNRAPLAETVRRAGEAIDLPSRVLPGFSHLEFWQNRQAVVEGVKGVLGYSEKEIQLNLGSLIVTLRGAELEIRSYQGEEITLAGTIAEVHFTTT